MELIDGSCKDDMPLGVTAWLKGGGKIPTISCKTPIGSLTGSPASVAAWAMHGEFEMSKIESWDNTWFGMGPWTLWVYVMISNVLLVNLLIAMMSETYSRVKENALTEWMFDRLGGVLEMVERMHVVPPPFSLPILLHKFCLWAADGLFKKCFKRPLLARQISQQVALDEGVEPGLAARF